MSIGWLLLGLGVVLIYLFFRLRHKPEPYRSKIGFYIHFDDDEMGIMDKALCHYLESDKQDLKQRIYIRSIIVKLEEAQTNRLKL